MRQIINIKPFWDVETNHWVFTDDSTGLDHEPFVLGMGEIIEAMLRVAGIPLDVAREGFLITASSQDFPTSMYTLTRDVEQDGGCWYRHANLLGWLCPALFKYFPEPPEVIHLRVDREKLGWMPLAKLLGDEPESMYRPGDAQLVAPALQTESGPHPVPPGDGLADH